jgi:hypothetical protein
MIRRPQDASVRDRSNVEIGIRIQAARNRLLAYSR